MARDSLGSGAQLSTAALKTGAFVILVIACFLLGGPAHRAASQSTASALDLPSGWPLLVAIMLGLQGVIYTVDGWDGVIYFGEEVRHPGRDIPRAIFGSVFSIMGIYLLLNLVALYILPMNEISGNNFILGTVASRIFGKLGDPIIRSIMVISMLSCLNANQLFCSRTLYTMSCDGLFFCRVARVNPGGTPVLALFLSTVAGLLFLLTGPSSASSPCSPFSLLRITLCRMRRCLCCAGESRQWRARTAPGVIRGRQELPWWPRSCFWRGRS